MSEAKTMPSMKEEDDQKQKKVFATARRFRRRATDHNEQGNSLWLISFTDIIALMLTFFVLLFAMTNPKEEVWKDFTQKIQENFNRFEGLDLNRASEDAINIDKINYSRALNLNYLRALIENLITKEDSLGRVTILSTGESLILSLPQDILFESGDVDIKESANRALYALGGTLRRIKNRIEIVGHTDPRPVSSGAYKSNWELSLARAANVAALLENIGYEQPVTIRGQASGRYTDIPNTIPLEERLDLSRRVDIIIMEDDGRRTRFFDIGLPELP